jgi:hypothetical protein
MAAKTEHAWGYDFGAEGVLDMDEAARLAGCSTQTLWRLREKNALRIGKHLGNIRKGKAVVCRRSLSEYLKSIEMTVTT